MAGPVVRILTPRPVELPAGLTEDCSIYATRPFGGSYEGEGRPFIFASQLARFEEFEQEKIETAFGLNLRYEVEIGAMCNAKEDHRILGELALYLADTHGGVIDFCGKLYGMTSAQSFPGKLVAVPYETSSGHMWVFHAGDPTFLKAWLQSPDFHMIK